MTVVLPDYGSERTVYVPSELMTVLSTHRCRGPNRAR